MKHCNLHVPCNISVTEWVQSANVSTPCPLSPYRETSNIQDGSQLCAGIYMEQCMSMGIVRLCCMSLPFRTLGFIHVASFPGYTTFYWAKKTFPLLSNKPDFVYAVYTVLCPEAICCSPPVQTWQYRTSLETHSVAPRG